MKGRPATLTVLQLPPVLLPQLISLVTITVRDLEHFPVIPVSHHHDKKYIFLISFIYTARPDSRDELTNRLLQTKKQSIGIKQ